MCIQDHRKFKALSQRNSVQKNSLFTYRIQGPYTFRALSALEFAELLSMRNTKVEVYISLALFAFTCGGKLGGQPCSTRETVTETLS